VKIEKKKATMRNRDSKQQQKIPNHKPSSVLSERSLLNSNLIQINSSQLEALDQLAKLLLKEDVQVEGRTALKGYSFLSLTRRVGIYFLAPGKKWVVNSR
jgi:hypothetical protein